MNPTSLQKSCITLLAILALTAAPPVLADGVDATTAFEQLKSMAGTWRGMPHGEGIDTEAEAAKGNEAVHEFRVSAAGTVVMETMSPGTDHEMINMYHIDGEDLMLIHYCAAGNQPKMRLDREHSTATKYIFDFAGGTNLDPAVDHHIHSAAIEWGEGGKVKSVWKGYSGGKEAGVMTFKLAKSE